MPRKKRVSDREVLDAAFEVVRDLGPQSFTLADVGARVSLSPATLLQRFGSKERLVERVVSHANERLQTELRREPSTPRGGAELTAWLIELARPLRTRALIAEHLPILRQDLVNPRLRRQTRKQSELFQAGVCRYLEAQAPQLDAAARARHAEVLEAHWHGLILQWALAGTGSLSAWMKPRLERLQALLLHPSR